ncbi:MAG: alanine racemase [Microbacteriaceae bacterium]
MTAHVFPALPNDSGAATPFLQFDRSVMHANIARMALWARTHNVVLRPHVKTHKSVELAQLQRENGAQGITVATIGEAEVFAAAGFDDVFIAYPLWLDERKAARLNRLSETARIIIGVDSVESLRNGAVQISQDIAWSIEVDSGHHRTGLPAERTIELGAAVSELQLTLHGVFTFPGHSYATGGRESAAAAESAALLAARASLAEHGFTNLTMSGGSTPSAEFADASVLTELRPGVYLFNDAQQWELGSCSPDEIALWAVGTVISVGDGRFVTDVGSKVLGADRAAYASGFGRLLDVPSARIVQLSEHHSVIETNGAPLPRLGSTVRIVPNHVCNAINLHDSIVDQDFSVVNIDARGRNS